MKAWARTSITDHKGNTAGFVLIRRQTGWGWEMESGPAYMAIYLPEGTSYRDDLPEVVKHAEWVCDELKEQLALKRL